MSASSLIRYLLAHSEAENWHVKIVDQNIDLVKKKINGHPNAEALSFNALDSKERKPAIAHADLVISMLPAIFHVEVAKDCIELHTDLITPSYISPEMRALNDEAKQAGIVIMNEIGVDPGIDHMSAMKVIDQAGKDPAFNGINIYVMDDTGKGVTESLSNLLSSGAVGALFLAYVPVGNGEARWVRVHHLRASNQLKISSLGNATLPITYLVSPRLSRLRILVSLFVPKTSFAVPLRVLPS